MKLNEFKTNQKKEVEGVWVQAAEDLHFLLARMNNKAMMKYIRGANKANRAAIRSRSDDALEALTKEAVARTVLLDWKGLTEDDGTTPIPFSIEKAKEIFDSHRDIYLLIVELASDPNHFRDEEELAESEGN